MGNNKLNLKSTTAYITIFVFILIFSIGQSSALIAYTDNNTDSDSNIDSTANISKTGVTDYTDAQTVNGVDQQIQEINTGAGISEWSYYKIIEIDATKVSADFTDFPFLISMWDSDLKTKAQADGDDIAFFDLGGNQLAHEIETFDQVTNSTHAELVGWVKTNISSTVNTKIVMKYGNPTMGAQENPTQVWSSNYSNIWHLNNNPTQTAPQILDSTTNNDGTAEVSMTAGDQVAGQLGTSLDFDGTDDLVNMGTISSNSWTALTMSAWVNRDTTDNGKIFSVATSNGQGNGFFTILTTSNIFRVRIATDGVGGTDSSDLDASIAIGTGTWLYLTATWDSATEKIELYVDGSPAGTFAKDGDTIKDNTLNATIGNVNLVDSRYLNGKIDEVRISSNAKSPDWITTEYNNQNSPSTFITLGTEVAIGLGDNDEDIVDKNTSNVDAVADVGTHSRFINQQTKDGVFDTLTENSPANNSHSLSGIGTGYMRIGDGTPHWGVTAGTISYWVRFNDLSVTMRPWGQSGAFETRVSSSQLELDWGQQGSELTSSSTFVINKWYFIAVSWNESNNTLKLYLGDESTSPVVDASTTSWTLNTTGDTLIENNFLARGGGVNPINGFGDDLRFYDTDRSLTEIQGDYNQILDGDETNLRSYYRLDNSFTDLGPDGNDGQAQGTTQFSSTIKPSNFVDINAELNLEMQWTAIPYTTADLQLSIFTGTYGGENLNVEYWNGASWSSLISGLVSNSWNNVSVSAYVTSNTFTIRYRDQSPTLDQSQDTWEIDVALLQMTNYELEWEHQVQSVDTTQEYYNLTIFGFSSNASESFEIQLWNQTSSSWLSPLSTKIINTEQWYNISISGNGVINSEITWRYRGDNETIDNVQTTLSIDYAGVASYDLAPIVVTNPADIQYDAGQTGNNLVWNATDTNPDNYTIYKDGVPDGTGLWSNAGTITKNVDGLPVAVYTYLIVFEDQNGNTVSDSAFVTVLDNINPTVNQPANISYEASSTGNTINWVGTDNFSPNNYFVYRDGSQVGTNSWLNNTDIAYNIDSLLNGDYNFTIVFFDSNGNSVSDEVWVNVFDTTDPFVDNPADVTYDEGVGGNSIDWNATDLHPDNYIIYQDGVQVATNTWSSGVPVSYNADGLLKGSYTFLIHFLDSSGNYINDTVIVTVLDGTPPSVSSPIDISYEEGDTGSTITWTISDTYPNTLTIYRDGGILFSVPWTSGDMTINVDGLSLGVYNYTIEVKDKSNNITTDTVWVTVTDTATPTITSPPDSSYSVGSVGNAIEWIGTDLNPSTYVIMRNTTQVDSGSWISSATISLNIDGLDPGAYLFNITLTDSSGNQVFDEVIMKVTSGSTFLSVPPDTFYNLGDTGNELSWTASDSNPHKYIIYNDSVQIDSGLWSNAFPITINIDGLSIGVYNFSIFLNDTDTNYITHQLNVTVSDIPLWVIEASNSTFVEGSGLQFVSWNSTDMLPANYSIYKDGSLVDFGTWDNATLIQLNITDYTLGFYEITIYVSDTVNNIISSSMWLNVTDTTPPGITDLADFPFDEGSIGNTIDWTATDNYASTYEIRFTNGTLIDSGVWTSGVAISYNVDSWSRGVYNLNITVLDSSGNVNSDLVTVTVNDGTTPVVTDNPVDFSFSEGTTGNFANWTATDKYNTTYEIRFVLVDGFANTTLIQGGNWDSGVEISLNVDSWPKGVYTISITFTDIDLNNAVDSVQITVTDDTAPVFTATPTDISFSEGSSNNFANWTATDYYNTTYELKFLINGTLIDSGNWAAGVVISYNLDAWPKGEYFITMTVFDGSSNSISDTVKVTIIDDTNPNIIPTPIDFSFVEGSSNNYANWTATDNYNTTYEVRLANGTLIDSGSWDSGVELSINVDILKYGVYDVTITFFDASGNSSPDTVTITVTDIAPPVIVSTPADLSFSEGSAGNSVAWVASDPYPATYEIRFANNTLFDSGVWTSGESIEYTFVNWPMGTYTITITVYDLSSNTDTDSVLITVDDTTSPSIVLEPIDINYVEGVPGNEISWTPTDLYPGNYEIFNNTVSVISGVWTNGTPIIINVDGLSIGNYNFTLYLDDGSGNIFTDIVWVNVIEVDAPTFTVFPPAATSYSEGTTGNTIDWSAFDTYNDTYIVYQNGSASLPIIWNNTELVSINIDGLSWGVYNFTIVIKDTSNNQLVWEVIVTVTDDTIPNLFDESNDLVVESGSTGNVIFWNVTDIHNANYILYLDGLEIKNELWPNDAAIEYNVDNLPIGTHTFFIEIYDQSGNMVSSTVIVQMEDTLVPVLTSTPPDEQINEGSIGNVLSWTMTDVNPDQYYVLKNDGTTETTAVLTTSWNSGDTKTLVIDGLLKGVYNYTIVIYDTTGNTIIFTTIITVIEIEPPVITDTPDLVQYVEETKGNILIWKATDAHPTLYNLSRNGVIVIINENWISGISVEINIDGLSTATYNFTIYFFDESDNSITSSFIITVIDTKVPVFVSTAPTFEYIEGNSNYNLIWNATDNHPGNFNLSRNGVIIESSSWDSSTEIIINIDGLSTGDYNFTLFIFDESLNYANHSIILTVIDTRAPTLQTVTEDFTYILGSIGNLLNYTAFDLHPQSYVLYVDGVVWETNSWDPSSEIIINIDGFNIKYYNFTIEIFDESRNSVMHSLIVRVKDPNVIDTQRPEITLQDKVFEGDLEVMEGTWLTIDNDTIADAEVTYEIFLQSRVASYTATTDEFGNYTLLFNYDELLPGNYYWVLHFEKDGYQPWDDIIIEIEVLPHTFNIELSAPDNLVQGEEYFISAILYYGNGSSTETFSLSEFISNLGTVEGVEVVFTIIVIDENGNPTQFTKLATSNSVGVALISLDGSQTANIASIQSIGVSIAEDVGFLPVEVIMPVEDFPTIAPGEPDLITKALEFLGANWGYIVVVIIVASAIVVVLFWYRKQQGIRINQINDSIKIATEELAAVKSIQSIIIQTSTKLTIYEENVVEDAMNTNLIGGMITAFSSFLNEIGRSELFGWEMMEREDVSLAVHKGKYSNFIVISTGKLPMIILSQIQDAQKALEDSFKDNFVNTARGVKKLIKSQVHPQFTKASFKIPLTRTLKLNTGNINKVMKEKSVSRALKQTVILLNDLSESQYSTDGLFDLEKLSAFFESHSISSKLSSRTIMLAYEFHIIEVVSED